MSNIYKDYYSRAVTDYLTNKDTDQLLVFHVIDNIGVQSFIEIVGHIVDYKAVPSEIEALFDPQIIINFYSKHEELIIEHFKAQMMQSAYYRLEEYLPTIPQFKSYMMCEDYFKSVLSKDSNYHNAIILFYEVAYWYLLEKICIDFNEYCDKNSIDIKVMKYDFNRYAFF